MNTDLINANSLRIPLVSESVQMVATSPPYYALRNYNTATFEGGDPTCDHQVGRFEYPVSEKQKSNKGSAGHQARTVCPKCGAVRTDKQLGMENLHDCAGWATGNDCGVCYICNLRAWAREVWRVLRKDGTFWLNLGDSYNGSGGAGGDYSEGGLKDGQPKYKGSKVKGLKPKDLMGIPARAALALQSDGWYWRSEFDWLKPNGMPSSATDRPGVAHETVHIFTKSQRYYFDMEAIRKDYKASSLERMEYVRYSDGSKGMTGQYAVVNPEYSKSSGRNYRTLDPFLESMQVALAGENSVIVNDGDFPLAIMCNTSSYEGSHFATWPPYLAEIMIRAGTSAAGCCPTCKAPWKRVIEKQSHYDKRQGRAQPNGKQPQVDSSGWRQPTVTDNGFQPACACLSHDPVPCLVADVFCGSGTTGLVARKLGRNFIGLDLSFTYLRDCAPAPD